MRPALALALAATIAPFAVAQAQPAADFALSAAYCLGYLSEQRVSVFKGLDAACATSTGPDVCGSYNIAISRLRSYLSVAPHADLQEAVTVATQQWQGGCRHDRGAHQHLCQ